METIGKYQVIEKIGFGGFGVVFKGYDPFLKRAVAIKTCTSDDEETRQRFYREGEIAGNLQHRNIVTVYDFGLQDGVPYLVQEYLSGEDLDRKIKRRDFLAYSQKLLYLIQIARGMEFAHSRGVVHRDIKPANIRILDDDTTKIMDFGIAKLAQAHTGITQAGITLGTAAYLAPEQIRGEGADQRTDIFSFGVLAYELLTFEKPFQGQQISTVFFRILNEQPRPMADFWPECPAELQHVVDRCLEKSPTKRYSDCGELLRDLEGIVKKKRAADLALGHPGVDITSTRIRTAQIPPIPAVAGASAAAGDVEIGPRVQPRGRGSASMVTRTTRSRRRWPVVVGVGLALAAAAGAGLWVLANQATLQTAPAGKKTTAAAPNSAATRPAGGSVAAGTGTRPPASTAAGSVAASPTGAAPGGAASGVPPAGSSSTAGSTTGTGSVTPVAPAVVTPPPPPPPPKPALLIIAESWSGQIAVRVGTQEYALDEPHRFELKPGSYTLGFVSHLPGYLVQNEVSVRLKDGEERRVQSPIPKPALLTVRPHLGARQGWVFVNGQAFGATPVQRRLLPPGAATLEISAAPEIGSGPQVSQSLHLKSDVETIVTFDVDGQRETRAVEKPVGPT